VLALEFADPADYDSVTQGDVLSLTNVRQALTDSLPTTVTNVTMGTSFPVQHRLSSRQIRHVLAGGLIPWLAAQQKTRPRTPPAKRGGA